MTRHPTCWWSCDGNPCRAFVEIDPKLRACDRCFHARECHGRRVMTQEGEA